MPKSTTSTDRVSDALAAITRTADALFKHTNKAVSIQNSTTRTTVMGRGIGPDALPAKDEVSALVQSMPGCADDDYADAADAKDVLCEYQIHTMRTLSKNRIHESVSMLSNNGHVLSRNSDLSRQLSLATAVI